MSCVAFGSSRRRRWRQQSRSHGTTVTLNAVFTVDSRDVLFFPSNLWEVSWDRVVMRTVRDYATLILTEDPIFAAQWWLRRSGVHKSRGPNFMKRQRVGKEKKEGKLRLVEITETSFSCDTTQTQQHRNSFFSGVAIPSFRASWNLSLNSVLGRREANHRRRHRHCRRVDRKCNRGR